MKDKDIMEIFTPVKIKKIIFSNYEPKYFSSVYLISEILLRKQAKNIMKDNKTNK